VPRLKNPATINGELLDLQEAAPLAIPVPHREHEHRVDPYKTLPGAMPDPIPHPAKRKRGRPRKDDVDAMRRAEERRRCERYDRYLDALISLQGDTDAALAVVYGIRVQEVEARHDELLGDVQAGVPASSISEMLKKRDLDKASRVTILRKWAFCNNPAASLKALDMLADLDEGSPQTGSYEQYCRLAMLEG
jgi:hypothetical protein